MPDFLPRRESDLLAFAANFDELVNAAPGKYGLSDQQSANYRTLYMAFAATYPLAVDPGTRTVVTVKYKDAAKAAMLADVRKLSKIVCYTPSVAVADRVRLGLSEFRPGGRPGRGHTAGPPKEAPWVAIVSTAGSTVRLRLRNRESPARIAKPRGISGATILTFVGNEPPTALSAWSFGCSCSTTMSDVAFDRTLTPPGVATRAWVTAQWIGAKQQSGPLSTPVGTWIVGAMAA